MTNSEKSIGFINPTYHPKNGDTNPIHRSIKELGFDIEYSNNANNRHDIYIYSNQDSQHDNVQGLRIFYTGESILPKWNECDYAIGFLKEHIIYPDCYCRFPYWLLEHSDIAHVSEGAELERDFCSFVVSDTPYWQSNYRIKAFDMLSNYKRIGSGGGVRNNEGVIERLSSLKIAFLKRYKFNLCFENYSCHGYSTEKIFDAFAANTLPIYWGDKLLPEDINPTRYINVHDFDSLESCIEHVKKVDADDGLYKSYFEEPLFLGHQKKPADYIENLKLFLQNIFTKKVRQIHSRTSWHGYLLIPSDFDLKE